MVPVQGINKRIVMKANAVIIQSFFMKFVDEFVKGSEINGCGLGTLYWYWDNFMSSEYQRVIFQTIRKNSIVINSVMCFIL